MAVSEESGGRSRVLVIRGGAIGDFIVTLPAMRLLKASIPDCRLEVLGYPGICELATSAGVADVTWNLDHRTMAPLFAPGASVDGDVEERLRGYSLVVSYLSDPEGHFRGNLERIGVKTLIEGPHRPRDGEGIASVQLARPLEQLAMFLEDPSPRIPGRTAPEKIRRVLLHPGSGSLGKNWAVSNWREIATEVKRVFPEWSWVLVTGEAEAERGQTEEILNSWPAPPEEHWEGLPLTELATRMMESEAVFLGHDSGISHLAAATGLPCFLLFGPSDPTVWAPPQPHVRVLKRMQGSLADLSVPPVWKELGPWLERVSKNPSGACDGTATC